MFNSQWINNTTKLAKENVERAANLVEAGTTPVNYLVNTALRLSDIANRNVNRMLEQQRDMAIGTVEAGANRLKVAASATDVRDFLKDQVELMPATRDRVRDDLRKTWEIMLDARDDLRGIFVSNSKDLEKTATAAKKKVRKTVSKAKKAVSE